MKNQTPKTILNKIIHFFGTQKKVAERFHISQQAVSLWVKNQSIPEKYAPKIDKMSNHEIPKEAIRPDLFDRKIILKRLRKYEER